jgi:hypothetical protein
MLNLKYHVLKTLYYTAYYFSLLHYASYFLSNITFLVLTLCILEYKRHVTWVHGLDLNGLSIIPILRDSSVYVYVSKFIFLP